MFFNNSTAFVRDEFFERSGGTVHFRTLKEEQVIFEGTIDEKKEYELYCYL